MLFVEKNLDKLIKKLKTLLFLRSRQLEISHICLIHIMVKILFYKKIP